MCLRRAPEKYITGAAMDRAAVACTAVAKQKANKKRVLCKPFLGNGYAHNAVTAGNGVLY
jgi:hypothetical protein